jgi:prepilin-type N-terminal cleavage/methylation domain-containing protein
MLQGRHKRKSTKGFGMVELLIAMVILAVGVLGGISMILIGMTRDNSNLVDTTATNVAQTVMEQIAGVPTNINPTLTLQDCVPNTLSINTAAGGATLYPTGDINFHAETAASLNANNYQMTYVTCGSNGLQTPYDVRWNIQKIGTWGKLVTVSAQQPFVAGQTGMAAIRPVTLRTVISM